MTSDFDHRKCPNCEGSTMRLTRVEPHRADVEDGYERHVYRCAECTNVSRFVFEVWPRQGRAVGVIKSPVDLQGSNAGVTQRI